MLDRQWKVFKCNGDVAASSIVWCSDDGVSPAVSVRRKLAANFLSVVTNRKSSIRRIKTCGVASQAPLGVK